MDKAAASRWCLPNLRSLDLGVPEPSTPLFVVDMNSAFISMPQVECIEYLELHNPHPKQADELLAWLREQTAESDVVLSDLPEFYKMLGRIESMSADLLEDGKAHVQPVRYLKPREYLTTIDVITCGIYRVFRVVRGAEFLAVPGSVVCNDGR